MVRMITYERSTLDEQRKVYWANLTDFLYQVEC